MNKKSLRCAALFMSLLGMFTFSSCSDDDNTPGGGTEGGGSTSNIRSITISNPGYGADNWVYFSFSKGGIVKGINESNRAENTDWDLAFYRNNIRTNGGLSGKGKGGALDSGKKTFGEVPVVPAGKFTTDVMDKVTSDLSSFPPPSIPSPLNQLLGNAVKFSGPPAATYQPNNHVYIIKTADGKYAKIQIISFYNDEGESGHVQMKYVYQPDGSTDLK